MNLQLSIIVPVYNVEKYLHRCMESLLAQNIPDYEIILVDDGSKDRSPEICDKYAQEYSFVSVIHKKNEGLLKVVVMRLESRFIATLPLVVCCGVTVPCCR